ncbi:glycerol-1-phosphate dehydrogenase [Bacillus glycinifermentans]|uniref:Glycerol-1-phosphate dehydrogenase n=1 Tax=Bacillus glycinifermentans TaxID=1664069 RepID=A0A0J6END7_9BACI|nr:sn-glycerol-1-phosphate dehydrogenase [Bacillus glycinifermentans]ATH92722.1 sn-glycerol-1-phosphate dehydrogenase [Bacillus glycinifermentans]KMM62715.1 glycerol-1-phosphate dehydrogenase [Bacillus glycinifermentans]KRT94770.1 glycerol-1-phosphate dehydrogenase [Bacillus glycinifermentans]MEC0485547.1 sn-glycerol-1-phosphate dehydrogenase [Bacillus glycinifermentans]MEC0493493.1 sn-glycerol-1-phosphate dehydrogenase [Bacillus glycinifermentans]
MNDLISYMKKTLGECECGAVHFPLTVEKIAIGEHAVENEMPAFIKASFKSVAIVCDETTGRIAGERLASLLQETAEVSLVKLEANAAGDVTADERTLVKALIDAPVDADALIAAGAGTIHDIVRFCAYQRSIPFISVPTAPSVDGFTSAGAPLILNGTKQTIQTSAPVALFADIELLRNAPQNMIAAGFGDMLGKITSLADWEISRSLADEPYCPTASAITRKALDQCLSRIDDIAAKSREGIEKLMESLIVSGLVMLMLDHSRPASGGEHHLSHYLEMKALENNRRQILHGAKVGCASIMLADVYRSLKDRDFGDEHVAKTVRSVYEKLPGGEEMAEWMRKVGGPVSFADLDVDEPLLMEAMARAHNLRDRYTGLAIMNQYGLLPDAGQHVKHERG